MKSIKKKIIVIILTLVIVLSCTLGAVASILNYNSSMELLEKTMLETAETIAERIEQELNAYINIAFEAGCNPKLADGMLNGEAKKLLVDQKVEYYGFERGNILNKKGESIFDGNDYSDREYFKAAMSGKAWVSDPLISKVTGEKTVIIAAPLWKSGVPDSVVDGVIYFVPKETFLSDIVNAVNIGDTGSAYMLNKDGLTIAHRDMSIVGVENTQELVKSDSSLKAIAALEKRMMNGETDFGEYSYGGVGKIMAFAPIGGTNGWSVAVTAQKTEFMSGVMRAIFITICLVAVFIIVGTIVAIKFGRSISRPVLACAERLKLMSEGDLSSPVPVSESKDETKELLEDLKLTIDRIGEVIKDVSHHITEISNGNLTTEVNREYHGDFKPLETATRKIIESLNKEMNNINLASDQVTIGAEQISNTAQSLSQGATEQASVIEELSATLTEISGIASGNAENSQAVSERAIRLGSHIDESNRRMEDVTKAMDEISASSSKISNIIKAIDDIAFQTNILALNAAVEAARAGAAGKGFAVVAEEVGSLAGKSADAVKDTTELIEQSISAVKRGNDIVGKTAKSLKSVMEDSQEMVKNIESISEASERQAESISQISEGVNQVAAVIHTNSATAEESAAAGEELNSQALLLRELVGRFRIKANTSAVHES